MNRISLALFLAVALAPAVAADHWDDDTPYAAPFGDSECTWSQVLAVPSSPGCALGYACTGGSPPQVVDTALYCSQRAAGEAEDIVQSVPLYAWTVADFHTSRTIAPLFAAPHDALQPTVDDVNEPLCNVVWSHFCTNPVIVPDDVPVSDPVQGYPL